MSRLDGKIPTGVDRVERAYLDHLSQSPRDFLAFGFIGSTGYIFSREHIGALTTLLDQARPANLLKDARAKLKLRSIGAPQFSKAETVTELFQKTGENLAIISVGHVFSNLKLMQGRPKTAQLLVMLHDTIPADFPQYQTAKSVSKFKEGLGLITDADLVICNSNHTNTRATALLGPQAPAMAVLPLGVAQPKPIAPTPSNHPYFVQLGTIEPRKNHALTLAVWDQLWQEMGPRSPHLYIIGQRGWMNEDVFATLDHAPFMNQSVFEKNNASDQEIQQLLAGAQALLFPSFAEGFGYPLFEARQLGTAAIVSNLDVFREFDDPLTLYISDHEIHNWINNIKKQANLTKIESLPKCDMSACNVPRWSNHFSGLEKILDKLGSN